MSVRTRSAFRRAMFGLTAIGLTALAGAAGAGVPTTAGVGWVWANNSTSSDPYAPDPSFAFNSSGGAMTVDRTSKGSYTVTWAGLGGSTGGAVLANAYSSNGWCNVSSWTVSADVTAAIACYDFKGNPADSLFVAMYQVRNGNFGNSAKGLGYIWADQPSATDYTPLANYSYNSTGGTNTVHRNGVGSYSVEIPGLTKIGGTVQVTAYQSSNRCKSGEWGSDVDGTNIDVFCFDKTGAAVDSRYTLTYARSVPVGYVSDAATIGGYAWADRRKSLNIYKPSKTYQFTSMGGGRLTAERSTKGAYAVSFPSTPSLNSSSVMATAYGSSSDYCNVVNWYPMLVDCYQQGGHVQDDLFNVNGVNNPE